MKKSILILTIGVFLLGSIGLFAQKVSKMPQASINGKSSGNITKTELLNAGKLTLDLKTKKLVSFVLVIGSNEYPNNSGYLFNNDVKAAINAVKKDTKIVFSKITVIEVTPSGIPAGAQNEVIKDISFKLIP